MCVEWVWVVSPPIRDDIVTLSVIVKQREPFAGESGICLYKMLGSSQEAVKTDARILLVDIVDIEKKNR